VRSMPRLKRWLRRRLFPPAGRRRASGACSAA
jgi:hypothetical protein